MKHIILTTLVVLCTATLVFSQGKEEEAIKKVITISYVEGLQNKGTVEDIEKGFHPGFELLGVRNNELTKWPIYSWVEYHGKKLEADPAPPAEEDRMTAEFPLVDVTGNAAIAKVELYKGGRMIFTDYLSLYKFEDGWKVVSKIYHKHDN